MRRNRSITLFALSIAVWIGAFTTLPRLADAAPPEGLRTQGRGDSSCVAVNRKTAAPGVVLLGETVDITLTVSTVCAAEQFPVHIVLVLDGSESMQGDPNREMKKAARELIKRLNLKDNPATQVGVVQFNSAAKILCQLTNQQGRVNSCIGRVGAVGGTNIGAGINAGLRVLMRGRNEVDDPDSIVEVMVVLSDGEDNLGCGNVQKAAGQVKGQGILLITVCMGPSCDVRCMRDAATSPRYFFEARSAAELSSVFERIYDQVERVLLRDLQVVDHIPSNMTLMEGSVVPAPNSSAPDGGFLTWRQSYVPAEGVTFTFKLRPQRVGYWPTNHGAFGEFTDSKGRVGTFEFRDPWVLVLDPRPLATATMPPPPPPPDTPGPTPTSTPTPTNTPTPTPGPIYLPITVVESCQRDEQLVDVALVLDMSTSMDRLTPDGEQKKRVVIEAARTFVDRLDFTPNVREDGTQQHDQAAVVWFNDEAGIAQSLSNDRTSVMSALDRLERYQQEGTRLDLAFERGAEALGPEHRLHQNKPVMILLTDGLPNRVPLDPETNRMEETVIAAARAAKDAGIRVYTVGFGKRPAETDDITEMVYPWLLEVTSSGEGHHFISPNAEDLRTIYDEIANIFTCPEGRHDWSEPWPPERGRAARMPIARPLAADR